MTMIGTKVGYYFMDTQYVYIRFPQEEEDSFVSPQKKRQKSDIMEAQKNYTFTLLCPLYQYLNPFIYFSLPVTQNYHEAPIPENS